MDFEQFHFLRPMWLALLPILFVVIWLMIKRRLGNRSWEAVCDKHLLPYMLIGGSGTARRLPIILTALCGILGIVSLAGPVWERLPQPVFNRQSALVIALDLSRSMDANDVSPSRLGRAKFKIADILRQHGEGQLALLVYAGDAFTVTPLTDDMETINSQLPALTTSIMPVQGSRPDRALKKAESLLKGAGHGSGNILLISDEIDAEMAEPVAEELESQGYRTFVLGIGTQHGAPILLEDGSFLKDGKGDIVIPVLQEQEMRQTAGAGGGIYRRMTTDDGDIGLLMSSMVNSLDNEQEISTEFETDAWKEQGPWLLLLLLPLAALSFRRGYILTVCFVVLLPPGEQAHALDWDSLWLRDDQRAMKQLENGNTEAAAALFNDPAWKAAAQYRSGDYDSTVQSLESREDELSQYNQGNALARLGQYEKAIEKYEAVLNVNPEHDDARFNKELLEKELEKQQQNQQQSGQDKQQQDEQKQQQESEEQQQAGDSGNEQDQEQDQQQDDQQSEQAGKDQQQQQESDSQEQQAENQQGQNEDQQEQQAQQKPEPDSEDKQNSDQQETMMAKAQDDEASEEDRATEQWLRRIPDDPSGLLRKKFRYQYQQRQGQQNAGGKQW